ncbi:MAG: transposase, partial [Candidatus Omnitrophota bacterium]
MGTKTVNKLAQKELVVAIRDRYNRSSKSEKSNILNEFTVLSGHHRKHAIRLFRKSVINGSQPMNMIRDRIYDEAVKEALIVMWEAADRICGKRLKAVLPDLVDAMERHGHLNLDP